MIIGVTGYQGAIGSRLVAKGCTPIMSDITVQADVHHEIYRMKPNIVIHCAALTDVAYCENHFKESFEVNVRGTSNVVSALDEKGIFIYLSSDHIFSGENYFNQGYGEWQKPSPVNRYGFSKWGGELAATTEKCRAVIVRSSKLFYRHWAEPTIERLRHGEDVEETDLIKRSFYHINHFVDNLLFLAYHVDEYPEVKVLNISGQNVFSYYLFWNSLANFLGVPGKVIPRREKLKDEAPRPFRGGLDVGYAKKLGIPLFNLQDGFKLIEQGL